MTKNFFKDGKWTDNPNQPAVRECKCGNKYIKTRDDQRSCLQCFLKKDQGRVEVARK